VSEEQSAAQSCCKSHITQVQGREGKEAGLLSGKSFECNSREVWEGKSEGRLSSHVILLTPCRATSKSRNCHRAGE
jgi:hypothetical protein